ncbi:hypothetical protein GMRT_jh026 [Giardia muris]|uniref:Uncharacterized protein n=1 Tax=Giardia muris TaxID=5742 RepID=A0A4Z1SRM7_GIAMU|nr:hypothetical protein GMRT_jh026 [Giardia muris]|eukprot:TNJ28526.1 hypothetical protein GMRT_jh026 [Giardia muris]
MRHSNMSGLQARRVSDPGRSSWLMENAMIIAGAMRLTRGVKENTSRRSSSVQASPLSPCGGASQAIHEQSRRRETVVLARRPQGDDIGQVDVLYSESMCWELRRLPGRSCLSVRAICPEELGA